MSKGVSRVEYQSSTRKARSVFQRLGSPVPSSMLKWTSPAWGSRAAVAHDPVRLALTVRIPLGRSVTSQRADAAVQMLQRDTSARGRSGAALEYLGDLPPIPFVVLQSGEGIQLTADQRRGLLVLGGRWQASAARIVVSAFTNTDSRGGVSSAQQRLVEASAIFLAEVAAIVAEIRKLLSADQIELLPDGVQRLLNRWRS